MPTAPNDNGLVPKNLEEALKHFDDSPLGIISGIEAIRILRQVKEGQKIAEQCFWYALKHSIVKQTSAYFRGRQRLAGSKNKDFIVTENDFAAIKKYH